MDWPAGSRQELAGVGPVRWTLHPRATKAWVPPAPWPVSMAWREGQVRPAPQERYQLPDHRPSERQTPALRPAVPARLRRGAQPVPPAPLAAAALPDAVALPPAPAQVVRSAGAAPRWVRLLDSAHSVRPPHGSARSEAARPEPVLPGVIRRALAGQSAAVERAQQLPAPEWRVADLLRPLGERQTRRCRRRSELARRPQAPWRDRRDRWWRSSGK
jgi:hypothetical protein